MARNAPWWLDPANFLTFVILPVFVSGAVLGGPVMTDQFKSFNFLTGHMIFLGIVSVCLIAIGAKLGSAMVGGSADRRAFFHPSRFDQFLMLLLAISLAAHLLLLGALILNPSLIMRVLSGEGYSFVARRSIDPIVGLTSLTNFTPLLCVMCAIRYLTRGKFFPSRGATLLALLIPPLIFIHAFVGSERLILVENGLAFMVPLLSFHPRLRRAAFFAPIVGLIGVVLIFAWGEYIRNWPFYQDRYDSFVQFAGLRFLAYLAVASNTGAGMVLTMPPVGYPLITAAWVAKLPLVPGSDAKHRYLIEYGNREFTNPSGIFAAIIDFGSTVGLIYLFLWGLCLGILYGFYRRGHPVGMLAFPLFYLGLVDLTQIWYWGQSPFVWQALALIVAIMTTVRRPVVQQQMSVRLSGRRFPQP